MSIGSFDASAGLRASLTVALISAVGLSVLLAVLVAFDLDWVAALRDANRSDGVEAGLISNLGIGMMVTSAIVLIFALRRQYKNSHAFLGLFCTLFAVDDALMLHERLNDLEILIFPFYALLLFLAWLAFFRETGKIMIWPLALAFAAFGMSAVTDTLWYSVSWQLEHRFGISILRELGDLRYLFEDGPKFVGLCLILALALGEARKSYLCLAD